MIKAFICGAKEFRLTCTTHYADRDLQDAYDWGRELAHRITFRHWEP